MTFSNIKEQQDASTTAVIEKWDLEEDQHTKKWYDAVNPRTGARYEVKSTHVDGRFRFWKDDLNSLKGYQSQGTAWVALVVFDSRDRVSTIQRRRPGIVLQAIQKAGGWNTGGHAGRPGKQKKLRAELIVR